MTLIQRLAREAAPCTGTAANGETCGVFSYARLHLCEYCEIRPEIEVKMRELVEACAERCDIGVACGQDENSVVAGWEGCAIEISMLLTEEETP